MPVLANNCISVLLAIIIAVAFSGCDSEPVPQKSPDAAEVNQPAGGEPDLFKEKDSVAEKARPRRELSGEEKIALSQLLYFSNNADREFSEGYYAIPDALHALASSYRTTFLLPRGIRLPERTGKPLQPPRGVFPTEEEKILAKSLEDMDRALEAVISHYRSLEKYVADENIVDNGKLGRQIVSQIEKQHGKFLEARKRWRAIVARYSQQAETALLQGHPLERQILAAGRIFGLMRQADESLAANNQNRENLTEIAQNISSLIDEGAKPPFAAAPALERLYRDFLKNCRQYVVTFNRGVQEGFFRRQKTELVMAEKNCRDSYNLFARQMNMTARD